MKKLSTTIFISNDELDYDFIKGEIETALERSRFENEEVTLLIYKNRFGKSVFLSICFIKEDLIAMEIGITYERDYKIFENLFKENREYKESIYLTDVTGTKKEMMFFKNILAESFLSIAKGLKELEFKLEGVTCRQ